MPNYKITSTRLDYLSFWLIRHSAHLHHLRIDGCFLDGGSCLWPSTNRASLSIISLSDWRLFLLHLSPSVWPGLPPPANVSVLSLLLSLTHFFFRLWSGLFISMQTVFLLDWEDKVFLECGVSKSTLLNNTRGRPVLSRGIVAMCYGLLQWCVLGGWIIGLVYFGQVQVKRPWKALSGDYSTAKNRPFLPIHTQHNITD